MYSYLKKFFSFEKKRMNYLNLDLLYVLDDYTFPLFYYSNEVSTEVYSPMTLKSVYIRYNENPYFTDYKTSKLKINGNTRKFENRYKLRFTEKEIYFNQNLDSYKSKPFKINQKFSDFLKSNKRIN